MKNFLIALIFLFNSNLIAQSSIVACYPFSGNANDASGNNNNGTVNGSSLAADRFGNPNSAYFFNGTSDIITFSPVNFYLNEFTYSVWCKPVAIPSSANYGSIFSIGGDVNDQVILIGNDASLGNIGFACGTWGYQSVFAHCYVGTQPSINNWHHIVFTRNNLLMKMFVDGQLVCSQPTGSNASYSGALVIGSIGARAQSAIQSFTGLIDDITVYDIALSDSQAINLNSTCESVGLQTNSQVSLNVFYNSISHSLDFTNNLNLFSGNFDLSLSNSIGQEVIRSNFTLNESHSVFSYALPNNWEGLYILTINRDKDAILTKKILIY